MVIMYMDVGYSRVAEAMDLPKIVLFNRNNYKRKDGPTDPVTMSSWVTPIHILSLLPQW